MTDTTTNDGDNRANIWLYFWVAVVATAAVLLATGVGTRFMASEGQSGLAWMTLAGGGFVSLVLVMFIAAIVFRAIGSHDPQQALGLPQGSVRSLLMFLVFSLLGVFVFFSTTTIGGLGATAKAVVEDRIVEATLQRIRDEGARVEAILPGGQRTIRRERTDADGNPIRDQNGSPIIEEVSLSMTEIQFSRPADGPVVEHLNQIAIAIFSMASSIIGFYFGTRSQVPPFGGSGSSQSPQAGAPAIPPGAPDSPAWALAADRVPIATAGGEVITEVEFVSETLAEDQDFGAILVPPEDARDRYKDATAEVQRIGNLLKIRIAGATVDELKGAQLSIYPVEHEDVAQAVRLGI